MNRIMLAANIKPRKRRKKPPRRLRRRCSGGLTGAVMSMVQTRPVPGFSPRRASEATLTKIMAKSGVRSVGFRRRRSEGAPRDALCKIPVNRAHQAIGNAIAPSVGDQALLVIRIAQEAEL